MEKKKCYLGFDVGKYGAIVGVDSTGEVTTSVMPLSVGGEISLKSVCEILKVYVDCYDVVCAVEDVHSIYGASAKANFQFGRGLGILEGFIGAFELPFIKVAPKTWQKVAFLGVPEIRNSPTNEQVAKAKLGESPKGSVNTKAMALIAAERLYPKVNLLATTRSKKPHEGIVDALLIAHFLKVSNL
mgnify:CR=1 FL=1